MGYEIAGTLKEKKNICHFFFCLFIFFSFICHTNNGLTSHPRFFK